MSFLKKIFGSAGKRSDKAYAEQLRALHGQDIKYVTEYVDGNENVVGRGGALTVKDDVLIIDSSGDRLFMCEARDVGINYLLSGNGVVISGANMLEDGRVRVLTVHFVYYRR